MAKPIRMLTIYNSPRDFPGLFVIREWFVYPNRMERGELKGTAQTLANARRLIPEGWTCIPRQPGEDTKIQETWVES